MVRSISAAACTKRPSIARPAAWDGGPIIPDADINFSIRLSELTKTHVSKQSNGEPNHLVVRLTDDALFNCPWLEMEDVGVMRLSDAEVVSACVSTSSREGFSTWTISGATGRGTSGSERSAASSIPSKYPIVDLTPRHPIFRTMFMVTEAAADPLDQSLDAQRRAARRNEAMKARSPTIRGIADEHGRLMVVMTHDTDISDAWEREGEDPRYFYQFSPDGYAVGINVVLYALTH